MTGMRRRDSKIKSRLVAIATLLGAGVLIVGGTVWLLLYFTAPADNPQPTATAATNYTPFVGRHW
jgi:hypothetical protein